MRRWAPLTGCESSSSAGVRTCYPAARCWAMQVGVARPQRVPRLSVMKTDRRNMTVRVVDLKSDEASDGRVAGTPAQLLSLARELSQRMWLLTGQPLPTYSRNTIPLKLTTLADQ